MFGLGRPRLGLIAGTGRFPLHFARAVARQGRELFVFGVNGITDTEIAEYAKEVHFVDLGGLDRLVELLRKTGVKQAVLLGGIPKSEAVNPERALDAGARSFMGRNKHKGDDRLLRAFGVYLKVKCGVSVVDPRRYLKDSLAKRGVMTRRSPTREEWDDLRMGYKMAKAVGRLDIGQTLVLKRGIVLAVEAVEGTDGAIRRGGELGHGESVVVKVSKPTQDLKYDLPSIGEATLEAMRASGCRVLGIENRRTFMLEREKTIAAADAHGLTIVGL